MGPFCIDILRESAIETTRSLREGFLELAWPTRCVGCDMPGELLCGDCRERLPLVDSRTACPQCGAPYGFVACTECWSPEGWIEHRFSQAVCAMEFEDIAARMIVAFKDGGELRLADTIAELIVRALEGARVEPCEALVPIPAAPSAILRRGYDHMDLVARALAGRLDIERRDLLRAGDVADQRGLGRGERGENMRDAFSLREDAGRSLPSRVLLVDDVLTTGATLDAAAGELLAAGVGEVVAATACRVW